MVMSKINLLLCLAMFVMFSLAAVIVPATTPTYAVEEESMLMSCAVDPRTGECPDPNELRTDCNEPDLDRSNCQIINYLVIGIDIMGVVAGMAIIASVVWAGFEYMTAQDNPGQVAAARSRIYWAVFGALPLLVFTMALLNWLVPGGVL